jgi:polysaccharide export outer membrane protein
MLTNNAASTSGSRDLFKHLVFGAQHEFGEFTSKATDSADSRGKIQAEGHFSILPLSYSALMRQSTGGLLHSKTNPGRSWQASLSRKFSIQKSATPVASKPAKYEVHDDFSAAGCVEFVESAPSKCAKSAWSDDLVCIGKRKKMSRTILILVFLLGACLNIGHVFADDSSDIYRMHPGDLVLISVWREDTLVRQVVVLPDGSVTFPLIGRVEAAGLSAPELERNIALKLKKYLPDPVVTVVIVGIDGNRAYVTGKVMHPGPVVINGPLTVLQAISLAGGLAKFADASGIKVIRVRSGAQTAIPVNFGSIMSGDDLSTNIQLKAGDTIVVP